MKAPKISKMLKNTNGFHPVIMGVVILAIVAIVLGVMIMTYSNITDAVRPSTFKSYTETMNDTSAQASLTYNATYYPIGTDDDLTAYSMVITNATKTLVLNTDYFVFVGNSTVRFSADDKNKSNTLVYDSKQGGTTSLDKIDTSMYKGFDLGSIAPIVLAAGLIISVVIGFAVMVGKRD